MKKASKLLSLLLCAAIILCASPNISLADVQMTPQTISSGHSLDLNGDGMPDTITFGGDTATGKYTVNVGGFSFGIDYYSYDSYTVATADILTGDQYKEIILTYDPNVGGTPDIRNYVLRYTGTGLIAAQVSGPYTSASEPNVVFTRRVSLKYDTAGHLFAETYEGTNQYNLQDGFVLQGIARKEVTINRSSANIAAGKKLTLKATVTGFENTGIKWTSSNTKVATVDATGKVTAKAFGKADIVATSKSNMNYFVTCKLTVYQHPVSLKNGSLPDLNGDKKPDKITITTKKVDSNTRSVSIKVGTKTAYSFKYGTDVGGYSLFYGDINKSDKYKELFLLLYGSDNSADYMIFRYTGKIIQNVKATFKYYGDTYKNKPFISFDGPSNPVRLYGNGSFALSYENGTGYSYLLYKMDGKLNIKR